MATGRLGTANLAAATDTTLCTVTTGNVMVATVNLCNTSSVAISVRIALCAANPPVAGEYIEYDATIPSYGVLERAGIVLDAGKLIVVRASATGINATAWGYEE